MRVLHDLTRCQHCNTVALSEDVIRAQNCGVDGRLGQCCKTRNEPRDMLESQRGEIQPVPEPLKGSTEPRFRFRKPLEVRCRVKTKRAKPLIEIAVLKGVTGVIGFGFSMHAGTASPAGHLEFRAR